MGDKKIASSGLLSFITVFLHYSHQSISRLPKTGAWVYLHELQNAALFMRKQRHQTSKFIRSGQRLSHHRPRVNLWKGCFLYSHPTNFYFLLSFSHEDRNINREHSENVSSVLAASLSGHREVLDLQGDRESRTHHPQLSTCFLTLAHREIQEKRDVCWQIAENFKDPLRFREHTGWLRLQFWVVKK